MKRTFFILAVLTAALLSYGLYQAAVGSPPIEVPVAEGADPNVMSNIFRIFYYHVSSAWTAFLLFFVNFVASIWYVWKRNLVADAVAVTAAEVGVVFCTVVLVTGPIWARPVWNVWWTWDARLTSTLVMWLIYVSYLMLRRFATGGHTPVLAAALAIIGFADVPFVYLSIRFFNTNHPQPVIGGGAESYIYPAMLRALLVNFAAFLCFAFLICWSRYRLERVKRQLEEVQALEGLLEPRGTR
jgi:heme exporter protein C